MHLHHAKMMPSRGLHLARRTCSAPRPFQLQCRNLSSTSSRRVLPPPRIPGHPFSSTPTPLSSPFRQWQCLSLPAFTAAAAASQSIRHASTTTTTTTTPPPTEPPSSSSASSAYSNMDTITIDSVDVPTNANIAAMPEKIGYLHDIGLNYGWGPTSALEWIMEHFHISAGLPWWGSIAATAVLLRVVLIPFYLKSSDSMARQQALTPLTKPITDEMTAAQRNKDNQRMAELWNELRTVRRRGGISLTAQFVPMIAQGIFGYCGFRLLRAAAALPVPAFKTDGFLWLSDLTVPDPYLICPAVMAATIHLLIRMGGESGAANPLSPGMQNFMLWGMPGIVLLATGYQSGAVVVWFAAGGLLGVIQSLLLQRPMVRELVGIAPLYKHNQQSGNEGLGGFIPDRYKTILQSSSSSSSSGAGATQGKNAAYMQPTYQSPNLKSPGGKTLDVSGRSSKTSAPQAEAEKGASGGGGGMMAKFNEWKAQQLDNSPEARTRREKEQYKKRADAYEKRAAERKKKMKKEGRGR